MSTTQSWSPPHTAAAARPTKPATGRRRHARHSSSVRWQTRAGVAGGVIGAAVLTSGAAPAGAATASEPSPNEISQTLDLTQLLAANATAQAAVDYQLDASQSTATDAAAKTAQALREAERAKAAAAAHSKAASVGVRLTASVSAPQASGIAAVLSFVKAQVGKAYVMGGTGPSAYDCSGLVQAAFRTIGVELPRVSGAQSTAGTQVSLSALQPGDILYWGSAGSAYHVAIYIGGGMFIGAQNPSTGVVERPLSYSEPSGAVRVR